MLSLKVHLLPEVEKQLLKPEVDTARQLSWIHVERVIRVIKQKYSILESALNINMIMCDETTNVSVIHEIVTEVLLYVIFVIQLYLFSAKTFSSMLNI